MLLILEGCNGVGKSYQAKEWSKRAGAPVVRAFRPSPDFHYTGATTLEKELNALGVPVNTYVDDLYVADVLGNVNGLVPGGMAAVLDRSMPSAIAYGTAETWRDRAALLALWQQLLARVTVVKYVWMVCPYSIAAQRVAARGVHPPSQSAYERLEQSFHESYEAIKLSKTVIDTGASDPDETTRELCRLSMI